MLTDWKTKALAIAGLVVIELAALSVGIDGVLTSIIVFLIGGIAGYDASPNGVGAIEAVIKKIS